MEYKAKSDKDTPLNLTNHTYFNFSGAGSIENHMVRLDCPYILEVNDLLIPTGRRIAVSGGPFDFTVEKRIGADIASVGMGYDHCFILADGSDTLKTFGGVYDPESGIAMDMATTLPAVQFYTGNFLTVRRRATAGNGTRQCVLRRSTFPIVRITPIFPRVFSRRAMCSGARRCTRSA